MTNGLNRRGFLATTLGGAGALSFLGPRALMAQEGGTLRFALSAYPPSFDAWASTGTAAGNAAGAQAEAALGVAPAMGWTDLEQLTLPTELTRAQILESFAAPGTISFWSLPGFIKGLEAAGVAIVCICARHAKWVLKCKINKSDAEGLASNLGATPYDSFSCRVFRQSHI